MVEWLDPCPSTTRAGAHSPFGPQPHHLEVLPVSGLDPLDALQLRVDHQGPALRIDKDRGVLRGHPVAGEGLVVPVGYGGCIGEEREYV